MIGNQRAFEIFNIYRTTVADNINGRYTGTMYPHGGFVDETGLGGQLFDPSKGAARSTNIDAMMPAFLAAYSNRSLSDRNNLIPAL